MKLGKLPVLPWYLRLMAFLVVGGVLYAGFWYFVTSGTRKETKAMEEEIASLRTKNAQAAIVQQNLNNFKAAYKAREEEFAELKALLPEQRELTGGRRKLRAVGARVSAGLSPNADALDPGFHGARTHCIRGFMAFHRLRPASTAMLMVSV